VANLPLVKGPEALLRDLLSATIQGHVIYETRLELARLLAADLDSSVQDIRAQLFLEPALL